MDKRKEWQEQQEEPSLEEQPVNGTQEEPAAGTQGQPADAAREETAKKRWFGRGIYGSKDVPIRLLDGLIAGLIAAAVILTVIFAVNGGFRVTFDTAGGSAVAEQKLRHGELVKEPEAPVRPGYVFEGWFLEKNEESTAWDFQVDNVGGDLELTAHWVPAQVTVKFDLDGGSCEGAAQIAPVQVTFEGTYGELPVPEKEGFTFGGWYYSGARITADTQVTMTGEHVLTARWE